MAGDAIQVSGTFEHRPICIEVMAGDAIQVSGTFEHRPHCIEVMAGDAIQVSVAFEHRPFKIAGYAVKRRSEINRQRLIVAEAHLVEEAGIIASQTVKTHPSFELGFVDRKRFANLATDEFNWITQPHHLGIANRCRLKRTTLEGHARFTAKTNERNKAVENATVEVEVGFKQSVRQLLVSTVDVTLELTIADQNRAVEDSITHINCSGELALGDFDTAGNMREAQIEITVNHTAL